MIHLRAVSSAEGPRGEGFPPGIPALQGLSLRFETPVTVLVGENACGKSTLLEALAWATRRIAAGSRSAPATS